MPSVDALVVLHNSFPVLFAQSETGCAQTGLFAIRPLRDPVLTC
jgi:hypothetical protein